MVAADPDHSHPLCTAREAAALLRIDRASVFRMLAAKKLTRVKVESRTFVLRQSIEDYLAAHTEPAVGGHAPVVRGGEGARGKRRAR